MNRWGALTAGAPMLGIAAILSIRSARRKKHARAVR